MQRKRPFENTIHTIFHHYRFFVFLLHYLAPVVEAILT